MTDAEKITFLEKELGRAYRALCGYATAGDNGAVLDKTARAYHSPTVAAAKRFVLEDALDGAAYFEGKPIAVMHAALALTPQTPRT